MGLQPIKQWDEMKFVLPSYKQRLLDKYSGLTQGSSSVAEYMTQFDELSIRCDLREDQQAFDQTFQWALKIKQDMRSHLHYPEPVPTRWHSSAIVSHIPRFDF